MPKLHPTRHQSNRITATAHPATMSPRKLITAMSRRLSPSLPPVMRCMITHTTILRHTARSPPCRVFILPLFINHPWIIFTMAPRSHPPTFRLYHLACRFHTSRTHTPILPITRLSARPHRIHHILSPPTLSYLRPTTQPTGMTHTRLRRTKMVLGFWILSPTTLVAI